NILCDGGPGNDPVPCPQAPQVYLGRVTPSLTGAVFANITIANRVTLHGLVDFQDGHKRYNVADWGRCGAVIPVCEAIYRPEKYSTLYLAGISPVALSNAVEGAFIQNASFAKLREISATWRIPEQLLGRVGMSAASLTLAGRNLATWTSYGGLDPESRKPGARGAAPHPGRPRRSRRDRGRVPDAGRAPPGILDELRRARSRAQEPGGGRRRPGGHAAAHAVRRNTQLLVLIMRTHPRGGDSMNTLRLARRYRGLLALPLLAAMTAACSEITDLEQNNPGQILVRDAYVPENAALLVNGAIGDFECAFQRYAVAGGLMSDELANAWLHSTNFMFDSRNHPTNGAYGTQGCNSAQFMGVYTP